MQIPVTCHTVSDSLLDALRREREREKERRGEEEWEGKEKDVLANQKK